MDAGIFVAIIIIFIGGIMALRPGSFPLITMVVAHLFFSGQHKPYKKRQNIVKKD